MAAFDRGQVSFSSFDMFFRGENNQSLRKVFICICGMLVSLTVRQPPKKAPVSEAYRVHRCIGCKHLII